MASFWCGVRFRYGLRLGSKRCSLRFKTRFCAIHTSASPRGADVARVRLSAACDKPANPLSKKTKAAVCVHAAAHSRSAYKYDSQFWWVPDQSTLGECGGHPCHVRKQGQVTINCWEKTARSTRMNLRGRRISKAAGSTSTASTTTWSSVTAKENTKELWRDYDCGTLPPRRAEPPPTSCP